MKQLLSILDPRPLCSSEQVKPPVILFLAALVPTLHRYFGSIEFARHAFPLMGEFESCVYMFGAAFFLMGILPLVIVRFVFRESLKSYGLNIGDWRMGFPVVAILFLLIVGFLLYPSSQTEEMRSFYPFHKEAGNSILFFFVWKSRVACCFTRHGNFSSAGFYCLDFGKSSEIGRQYVFRQFLRACDTSACLRERFLDQ